jgi:hypothetical protein
MQQLNPLLIGVPFTYKLIDFALLKRNNIEPILTYQKGTQTLCEGQSEYYDSLHVEELGRIIESSKVDAIVCFNDNFLIEAAQLRTKYKIPGASYPDIQKYKIKSEMYKSLSPYLMVPKTLSFSENLTFEEIVNYLGEGEYFIKPDNLAGAEGGCHIRSKRDYMNWKKSNFNLRTMYLVQKYYSAPLYHCELIIKNNVIQYIQARRYSYPNHMFLNGKIIASFPIIDSSLQRKIEQEAIKVQQKLGYKNGVMHTEFFLENEHNLIFLETNIRPAGGAINLIHRRRAGIAMETAMVLLELNKNFTITLNKPHLFDFCGYIPLKKGQVSQICLPKLKGHYSFDIRVEIGASYEAPKSASNTAVSFVGYSSDYSDLSDDFFSLENNDIIKYTQSIIG